jgi:hypothetical protein
MPYSELAQNIFVPGKDNNYAIAGNICNAFALGNIGSQDDFFLVGAEPADESPYPLLTGTILDSEGGVLFRVVRNVLTFNPKNCSRIYGDFLGYEIHDSAGKSIFKVTTKFERIAELNNEFFVTTIAANFYNKSGQLVFRANSGEKDEHIELDVASAFGFAENGSLGLVHKMGGQTLEVAKYAVSTRGAVHQLLTGSFENREISIEGKAIQDATFTNCQIQVETGDFVLVGANIRFERCNFNFVGSAAKVRMLVLALIEQRP